MRPLAAICAAGLAFAWAAAPAADESELSLKAGPDAALTRARCSSCHSVDYIIMNSVFLKGTGWDAEVHKMIKAMGAPISEDDASKIIAYLTRYYGD